MARTRRRVTSDSDSKAGGATTPLREVTRVVRAVGASTAGISALFAVSGYLAEQAFAGLLGIDFTPPASEMALTGGQFFLCLVTKFVSLSAPALLILALVLGLYSLSLLRRWPVSSGWARVRRLADSQHWLIGTQLSVWAWLLLHGVAELADLVPLAQLLSVSDGLFGVAPELLREGSRHFSTAILLSFGSVLLLCGLELWRIRLARAVAGGSGKTRLALFLSVPLYLAVLVQFVTLPVGYGMLQLPLTRVYAARTVSFRDDLADASLRGKTLRLVVLRQSGTQYSFYCPRGGRAWRDIEESQLVSVGDDERAPLLSLLERSEWPVGCVGDGGSSSAGRKNADAAGGLE